MKKQSVFDSIFAGDYDGLLPVVSDWVKKVISRRLLTKKLILISAVCPDYARENGGFTYVTVSGGIPFIALQQLEIVERILPNLKANKIELEYHVTLADTEFDLPFVVERMTGGDPYEFLSRCQSSCNNIAQEAHSRGIPLKTCRRFTEAFPTWYSTYHAAIEEIKKELVSNDSVRLNLEINSTGRESLYQAMTTKRVTREYCREMAIRQWAQYMTWGRLAESTFGTGVVMMNHSTPNLSRVNHPFARQGQERIPILQLSLSTMPVEPL